MTLITPQEWTCPICLQTPVVCIEVSCPACDADVRELFEIHFSPCGSDSADHDAHLAAEQKFVKNRQQEHVGYGTGELRVNIPRFFKDHIKRHEERAFKGGATSRDPEIRTRIEELNRHAESIIARLTTEILLKRQQECAHGFEKRWLPAAESGRVNLLCSNCFKVVDAKFVGTSKQHGETIGLKIVTEK